MAKWHCMQDVLFNRSNKKYFLYKKKKALKIQLNIYFKAEEATVMANIQIKSKRSKIENSLENLYLKWDKLAPTEE